MGEEGDSAFGKGTAGQGNLVGEEKPPPLKILKKLLTNKNLYDIIDLSKEQRRYKMGYEDFEEDFYEDDEYEYDDYDYDDGYNEYLYNPYLGCDDWDL